MKSKYYLRGFGTGVLFATIILMISLMVHDNMASNQKINSSDNAGVQNNLKEDSTTPPESTSPQEEGTPSESTTPQESETPLESTSPQEEGTPSESTTPQESETPPESTTPQESETPPESTSPQESNTVAPENEEYVTLNITSGMTSNKVAELLQASGVVESGYDLNMYLYNNGYENKIRVGTYSIRKGASYQEIAETISRR